MIDTINRLFFISYKLYRLLEPIRNIDLQPIPQILFCSSVTESCVGNGTARALKFPGWPAGSFLPVIFSSLAGGPSIERHHRRDETCAHFPRWRANGRYRLNRDSFTRALLLSFPCVGGAQQGNWGRASCCRPEPPCPSPPTTLLPLGSRPT
jgi:hypothetical protein